MNSQSKSRVFLNLALFQLGWFACVLGAAYGRPWLGTIIVAAIVAWHLWSVPRPSVEGSLIVQVVMIGAIWDSLLVWLGWITYPAGTLVAGTAPHWIVALWALFATALNISMRWLKGHLWLAAALGGVCGPLSYWAAVRLGAVVFTQPIHALVALAVGWAILMPALMLLSQHYDGTAVANEQVS